MPKRRAGNWLLAYREYTKESESPESYHLFCGLSALSAVVRRNVWLDMGIYLLYPNVYAALVGPPGRCGKSTAMDMSKRLLNQVAGITVASDSLTREEFIRELVRAHHENQSALAVYSGELADLIDPSGIKMVSLLTSLYNCPPSWRYSTKGAGKDEVINPYVTLLAATTPAYISDTFSESVIEHGFTSRVVFIYEERERFQNPYPAEPPQELVKALAEDLIHISQLKGEFHWNDSARAEYERFYRDLYEHPPGDHRVEGYHWRKKIHVLKIAMLCSMAEKDERVITEKDIKAAVDILSIVEPKMSRTFKSVGKYDRASDLERIQHQILSHGKGGVRLEKLLRDNFHVGSLSQLEEMVSFLLTAGVARKVGSGREALIVPILETELWEG